MNTSQLSKYAPAARRAFIGAVSGQAAKLGITAKGAAPTELKGDVLLIGGQAFSKAIVPGRKALVDRIEARGFDATMEAIAYTWFNRFAALRYMEVHGYLDHGYRVLGTPEGPWRPEILDHVVQVDLRGLDRDKAVELKLDGTKDEELYRLVLLAQCNALNQAMPFLFEKIGDETELLLPANLLHTDSLIRQLVEQVDEDLWQEIEIIGWLYQFYISEKKDQVIGKVVKSEDIPAATQLFTPNWIVKYLVQNSLGAQWLATHPQSALRGQMEYYIEPAEQTDEVKAQLAAITPSQLDPEVLTLIDPACGSGHILVEAYELFKAIYLERGYRQTEVPQLILEKNLFGLDIDERAAQLTGFALMMKGRADDRRLFERGVKLNVTAFKDSHGLSAAECYSALMTLQTGSATPESPAPAGRLFETEDNLFTRAASSQLKGPSALDDPEVAQADIGVLLELFEHATTFGALLEVPTGLAKKLPALRHLAQVISQDLFVSEALRRLVPLVQQAEVLAAQYDAVVANPPYMGSGGMNPLVKEFAKDNFPRAKSDLFACFIQRGFGMTKDRGSSSMVTIQNWMFLSSYDELRRWLVETKLIRNLMQIGYNSFPEMNSKVVQCVAWVGQNSRLTNYTGTYVNLNAAPQSADKRAVFLAMRPSSHHRIAQEQFGKVPGFTFLYWAPQRVFDIFDAHQSLHAYSDLRSGISTGDNERFYREWSEVDSLKAALSPGIEGDAKWFPIIRGGDFRRWYGNRESLINLWNGGHEIENSGNNFRLRDPNYYCKVGVTWSRITSGRLSFRIKTSDVNFGENSPCLFSAHDPHWLLALLNSRVAEFFVSLVSPTLSNQAMDIGKIPVVDREKETSAQAQALVRLSATDWDAFERSWNFQRTALVAASSASPTIEASYSAWITQNRDTIAEMKRLEEQNNHLFIDAYGLAEELTPNVPIEQITLTVNPAYRYGGKLGEEEQWTRFREDTMEELVSYAIGCMMGRYSLDAQGLIYAHSGNAGFDPSRYTTFPADDDGIVPLTDCEWFDDDAANRVVEFVSAAWDAEHLEENLAFLADGLSAQRSESSRETLRRYLCDSFFKNHLQMYKKRPIYWLFSSGREKAFQGLVYLHRYHAGTLARMRTKYVIPLQGKMSARIEQLEADKGKASSTSHRRKLQKEQDALKKQLAELLAFDEKLRHAADQKISLDLDDGVKVNYGKFGDLLAEVKAVAGGKDDE